MKRFRGMKKYTQEQTARLLDITLNHYQKIESGSTIPNVILGLKIARILDVDPFELFDVGEIVIDIEPPKAKKYKKPTKNRKSRNL